MSRRSVGFTLIEVVVGLATAATILLLARGILDGIGESGSRIIAAAERHDAAGNGELTLRELVATSGAVAWDSNAVSGDGRRAQVRSRCRVAGGWREPCVVRIEVVGDSLVFGGPRSTDRLVLATGLARAGIVYLRDAANGGHWAQSWPAATAAPLAIGLVMDADTLVLPTGVQR